MGWTLIFILALVTLIALWRFGRLDRGMLQFVAASLFLAMAGYAWQGHPGLAGRPKPPPVRQALPDTAFAETRHDVLGRFDSAAPWLTMADSYHRAGDTRSAVGIIRSGLRKSPRDPDLWIGLGNALVLHADGLMTPAAQMAFNRAEQFSPGHPGPQFFYGLALAQGGQFDEAERIWRELLERLPAEVSWRPLIEERIAILEQARAMQALGPASPPSQ